MVPNVMAPFLILLTAVVGQAILAEASLSYLGLGVQEPVPAWGLLPQGGAEGGVPTAPLIAIFPDLAIALTVFGFSLFGDALRRPRPQTPRPLNLIGSEADGSMIAGRFTEKAASCLFYMTESRFGR